MFYYKTVLHIIATGWRNCRAARNRDPTTHSNTRARQNSRPLAQPPFPRPAKCREMCGTARRHSYARRSFQARARAGNASAFAVKPRDAKRNHCRTPRARLRRAARGGRARRADPIAQRIARTTTAGAAQLTTLCRTPANTEASPQYHRQRLQPHSQPRRTHALPNNQLTSERSASARPCARRPCAERAEHAAPWITHPSALDRTSARSRQARARK